MFNVHWKRSKWESTKTAPKKKHPYDHIETYLQEPTISSQAVKNAKGYMAYWHAASQTCPLVAKMAMDFVSAPGNLCLLFFFFFSQLNFI